MKRYSENELDEVTYILKNNGVISVPTDTVYGICAIINSKEAFDKIKFIKKRPDTKSFPIMCKDIKQIKSIAVVTKNQEKLINAFMPGPITLVLKKKTNVNNAGLNYTDELAVRMAPTEMLKRLIDKVGSPIFMTSANISGEEMCKSLDEIEEKCKNLDGILTGEVFFKEASTIVDLTKDEIIIQREGPISIEQIMNVLKK